MAAVQNIHGRKWGRGLRPWLLIPKYLAVSLLLGGLGAVAVLSLFALAAEPAHRPLLWQLAGCIYRYQVIPASAAAVLLGIGLFLQHPAPFWGMRWFRVKLACILITLPLAHVLHLRQLQALQTTPDTPNRLPATIAATLFAFLLIAILGRLKPRLGQPYQAT